LGKKAKVAFLSTESKVSFDEQPLNNTIGIRRIFINKSEERQEWMNYDDGELRPGDRGEQGMIALNGAQYGGYHGPI
jgi:hypothetical protein